ncbi:hypothetical protein ACFPVY_11465 [Flavobacterium qiangtangense]|uniref:Preprotein translocase subunit SecE n=1 Tax=Flavobacterium qiangtangense TaxID=1442595 RepID=A0ABW1PR36_9FLAO
MKQLLHSIPAIIENETRVSWLVFKVVFVMALFASIALFVIE